VRKGDTLETLAKKNQSDAKTSMLANNMRRPEPLTVGKTVRVPLVEVPTDERPAATQAAKAPAHKSETIDHVVRPGDSLWNIAKRYGTTTQEIERSNRVNASNITLGQVLKIVPGAPPPLAKIESPKPRPAATYTVRKGDTLQSIAKSHNTTVERLLSLNKMQLQSKIQPGQKILVD